MIFYKYTLNKMFKSVSTYITGLFGVIPILALGIMAMTGNGVGYSLTSLIILATFPLFVVFITFKTVQVFRDEIENQTMLTIVSKPFPRKKLVMEGLLSLFTIISILAFVGLFLPMLGYLRTESNSGEVILKALLVTLTTILLGGIIAALGMLLSLKMKGKAFIGIMLAIFGIGFYALWGTMTGIRTLTSRAHKIDAFNQTVLISPGVKIEIENNSDGSAGNTFQSDGKEITYILTGTNLANVAGAQNYRQEAVDIYNQFLDLQNFQAMDAIKWLDPTLHWQVMYNGAASVGNQKSSVFQLLTNGADVQVDIDKSKDENGEVKTGLISDPDNTNEVQYRITTKVTQSTLIPIYYPLILWALIGGVVVGLSFTILNKSNIS